MRFAHKKVVDKGSGIVALITNNSYLDGVSHKKMRESLLKDFDRIYILNLHGNSIKKELDDNVFNEGSFDLINNSLNMINKNESKMCGIQWNKNYMYDIVYTTFFITDIPFLLEIFKIPTNKDDWYDIEIVKKYKLYTIIPPCRVFHNSLIM